MDPQLNPYHPNQRMSVLVVEYDETCNDDDDDDDDEIVKMNNNVHKNNANQLTPKHCKANECPGISLGTSNKFP